MRAVILAGGKGTWLAPLTKVFPKPLMSLGDKSMLEIMLRQLRHSGFTHITLAVGHMAEMRDRLNLDELVNPVRWSR